MIVLLHGKKESGKSTLATELVDNHGFVRMGFAVPLKNMLHTLNPLVRILGGEVCYLADLVDAHGWDWVKKYTVETRGYLQRLGTDCIRKYDDEFWLKIAEGDAFATQAHGQQRIVIDDLRFDNEATCFPRTHQPVAVWHIIRPRQVNMDSHPSEAGIDPGLVDFTLHNDGSIAELQAKAADVVAKTRGMFGANVA